MDVPFDGDRNSQRIVDPKVIEVLFDRSTTCRTAPKRWRNAAITGMVTTVNVDTTLKQASIARLPQWRCGQGW